MEITKSRYRYLIHLVAAVDDVALRLRSIADKNGLSHKTFLHAHTLKAEKTEVYK